MSDRDTREEICPDCQATEANMDSRVTSVRKDEPDGEYYAVVSWHTDDCPAHTVERILMEDGVRRAKEQSEWGRKEFPAAYGRLIEAVMKGQFEESAAPFVQALVELVEAQGEDLGRIVLPARWAEILNKHFPPGDTPTA